MEKPHDETVPHYAEILSDRLSERLVYPVVYFLKTRLLVFITTDSNSSTTAV